VTVTDQQPTLDPTLIDRARELVRPGRMPSKRELQKHLGKSWDTVNAVLSVLADERSRKPREARAKLRRLTSRKRPVAPLRARFQAVNGPAPALALPAVPEPMPQMIPEAIQKRPEPVAAPAPGPRKKRVRTWPVLILCLPAFVAIWGGWVDLGGMTGFGVVHPFPGIPGFEDFTINTAITLPFGMETYAAYALHVWLSGRVHGKALRFARSSAIGSLLLGFAGQSIYHLMTAAGWTVAPWPITLLVSGIPVAVLGMGAALAHMVRSES
jgi:hypothetical protein